DSVFFVLVAEAMSLAADSKRALLSEDVPWRASPDGKKPVPRIHRNPLLRVELNPDTRYALAVMKVMSIILSFIPSMLTFLLIGLFVCCSIVASGSYRRRVCYGSESGSCRPRVHRSRASEAGAAAWAAGLLLDFRGFVVVCLAFRIQLEVFGAYRERTPSPWKGEVHVHYSLLCSYVC
ncbi:hypothetical protein BHM03_00007674, partial [Ensete ventricosum]